ncbi:MAG TPA: MMPL family transporter, partial [Planctomycetaceae bacterium]|nr:MMPL family transporter [Planctomycetaceae bacterium]
SVALGLAVDGTLHLITWFRQLIRQGMSRQEAVAKSLEHCAPALWQTSAAIGIGMMALYPVELLLISRFGWIMAGMIFAALWGDVILLPALLAGPLGMAIEAVEKQRREKDQDGSNDAEQDEATFESNSLDPHMIHDRHDPDGKGIRAANVATRVPHFPRIRPTFPERSGS